MLNKKVLVIFAFVLTMMLGMSVGSCFVDLSGYWTLNYDDGKSGWMQLNPYTPADPTNIGLKGVVFVKEQRDVYANSPKSQYEVGKGVTLWADNNQTRIVLNIVGPNVLRGYYLVGAQSASDPFTARR